ncbi:PR domain zinc finger protein 10-like [Achroia grisella]|uniref:PR domain zinc finger protein 10-like n=1 Tax=Achroia grisella TaxID=688607 RepID=UPI0027D27B92|nr:PR domain zinc finger protein 10-like [Achroia grisella]
MSNDTGPTRMFVLAFDHNDCQNFLGQQPLPLQILNLDNNHYLLALQADHPERDNSNSLQITLDSTIRDNLSALSDNNTLGQNIGNTHVAANNISQEYINMQLSNQATESHTELNNKPVELQLNNTDKKIAANKICQNYVHIPDRAAPVRAEAVLPSALQLRRDGRVVSRRRLPARTRFGPLRGVNHKVSYSVARELTIKASDLKVPIFLIKNKSDKINIDVSDKDKSNWLSLLPLGDQSKANVWLYQEDNELYAITVRPLAARTILYLGYSKQYVEDHDLPPNQPVLLLSEVLSEPENWWCCDCHEAQASAALLLQHEEICHNEKMPSLRRRRYRCRHCTRTFSRLFTLRRHITQHCRKNKSDIATKTDTIPNIGSDTSIVEDKLPSDESFQNYSNGLDFSTNLFDTDRIPNLDISVSSRSEADFGPYGIEYKDDSSLSNYLELSKSTHVKSKTAQINKTDKPLMISCSYCHTEMSMEMKKQHIRQCPARRFECECGTIFNCKEKLAEHIYIDHPTNVIKHSKQDIQNSPQSSDNALYKCEVCSHIFKRRGMLVNHLWRVHRTGAAAAAAAVPLSRRDRCFPCGACPKLYRSRAKRDAHLRAHHPNAAVDRAHSILGGKRHCEPAACIACPRQYATRAKLLQHVRSHHPQLAPPKKKLLKNTKG